MSHPPKVLFVSYGGGHIGMVLPVMHALEARLPGVQCQLLALTTGYRKAKAVRPDTLGYKDLLHLVDTDAARAWGERLSAGNTSPDVPREETIAYLGINYLDLIAQHGQAGAAERYRERGRHAFRPLHFMQALVQALQPDAVVTTNSPRSERAALDTAHRLGLPTVAMVDLFGTGTDQFITHRPHPTRVCVLADGVRQHLLAQGHAPGHVVVTGNPAFDGLFDADTQTAAQRFVHERGWHGLQHILFAGHSEPAPHPATPVPAGQALPRAIEAVLRDYVRQRHDVALTVRYHPSDWFAYPRLPAQPRVHVSVPSAQALHPLLLAAQAVVVQASTVGLEAAVAGRPVVSVENAPSAHRWFSLAREGVSTPAATPQDLPAVLDRVLAGGGSPQASGYRSDGCAAQRVAAVIQSVLTNP